MLGERGKGRESERAAICLRGVKFSLVFNSPGNTCPLELRYSKKIRILLRNNTLSKEPRDNRRIILFSKENAIIVSRKCQRLFTQILEGKGAKRFKVYSLTPLGQQKGIYN
jgi:hypothetical protein